jgi:methylmalonyl-CoA mutase N-terminal domain/subunit
MSDFRTYSGLPLKPYYTSEDLAGFDTRRDLGDPGEFPFARGIHPSMYRDRIWLQKQLCGLVSPSATNRRLKFLLKEGVTGLAMVPDTPTQLGLDGDHPMAESAVGVQGVPITHLGDMERLFTEIPLEEISASFSVCSWSAPIVLAQYVAAARRRGVALDRLRGSIQNDPIQARHCCYDAGNPLALTVKLGIDAIEYATRHVPNFHPCTINSYDLRESGINAVQEMGLAIGIAETYIAEVLKRGLAIDEFAPRLLIIAAAHIDFFEEIAKFRAARRLWARRLATKFGAHHPKSLALKLAVHTAGSSLTAEQPVNNVVRSAYEAMAAILGGCQALDLSSYDEGLSIPSEASSRVSVRTQQILQLETGVTKVIDPLGGSYYVEDLSNRLEAEMLALLDTVERQGGMLAAAESGWLRTLLDEANAALCREIDRGERPVVGRNIHTVAPEDDRLLPIRQVHIKPCAAQVRSVKTWKRRRDTAVTRQALESLGRVAQTPVNWMPAVVEAVVARATVGEILGTIREANGLAFDPLGHVKNPFSGT